MFGILLKARIAALLNGMVMSGRKQKPTTTAVVVLIACLLIFTAVWLFALMFIVFWGIGVVCKESALGWLYFALAGLIAFVFSVFSGVFVSQTQLYSSKDNELLLAMPIQPRLILWTRVAIMFIINIFICSIVLIPAIIMYLAIFGFNPIGFLASVSSLILLPTLIFAIVAIIGWVLKMLSMKIKFKNLIAVLAFFIGFGLYMYFVTNAEKYIDGFSGSINTIADSVSKVFPLYHLGMAVTGNATSFIIFVLICVLPFLIIYTILSKTYFIMISSKGTRTKAVYVAGKEKAKSVRKALIIKELKRLASSVPYMLNACMGIMFCFIAAAFIIIYSPMIKENIDVIVEYNGYLYCALILVSIASFNFITAPSVSLEGKNLWIAKSLPVDPFEIIMAKVYMALVVTAPPLLILSIICCYFLSIPIEAILPFILYPQIANLLFELIGVLTNLKFPKFNAINDTQAVKQSMSLLLSMVFGWVIMGFLTLVTIALAFVLSGTIALWIVTFLALGFCALVIYLIKAIGVKLFENLS